MTSKVQNFKYFKIFLRQKNGTSEATFHVTLCPSSREMFVVPLRSLARSKGECRTNAEEATDGLRTPWHSVTHFPSVASSV